MQNSYVNFQFKRSAISMLTDELKVALIRFLTKRALPIFLRGKDQISFGPLANGTHEAQVKALVNAAADAGYSDFLVDIGANIGLTSCQSGNAFQVVHMYEPNPLCCKILEVNSSISLNKPFFIHPFGLGSASGSMKLMVPKDNWGGAFIAGEQNSYSAEVLAKKDGYAAIHDSNYIAVTVEIKDGMVELASLFSSLLESGCTSGVIKIDAEGFEPVILKAIAAVLPSELQAVVIYESWGTGQVESATRLFDGRARLFSLRQMNPWRPEWPRWLKAALLLLRGRYKYMLTSHEADEVPGEMVLLVESLPSLANASRQTEPPQ